MLDRRFFKNLYMINFTLFKCLHVKNIIYQRMRVAIALIYLILIYLHFISKRNNVKLAKNFWAVSVNLWNRSIVWKLDSQKTLTVSGFCSYVASLFTQFWFSFYLPRAVDICYCSICVLGSHEIIKESGSTVTLRPTFASVFANNYAIHLAFLDNIQFGTTVESFPQNSKIVMCKLKLNIY